jgi:hypothetical protein
MKITEALVSFAWRPAARPSPSWPTDLFAAIFFMALGIGLTLHPYATGREMPGDLGDARLNFALLEFFYRTLLGTLHGGPANFLDAPFFYPWPRVTNFADTHWGDAGVYVLARALGIGSLASFQVWFVAGFALTYVAAFASLRKFGLLTWGAAAGAFLFTFCLPIAAQFNHAQLVYRLWVPPAILTLDRLLTRRSLQAGAACVLFVGLQLACDIYLGLFLCLLLASYTAAFCVLTRNRLAPPLWAAFISANAREFVIAGILLTAGLLVLAIVAIPYFVVQTMYGFGRSWDAVAAMLPRPGSYLLAATSKLWPDLSATFAYPLVWEHQIFPGLSAIIPLAWFLLSKRARTRHALAMPMLAALAILFAVTIDLDGHTLYYWLIYPIPGFSAIRSVTRIILVMMLPLAALLGMLIDDLATARAHRLPRSVLAAALSVFLVAECSLINQGGHPRSAWQARLDALESRLPKKLPPDAILTISTEPPKPGDDLPWRLTQVDAEVAAVTFGISTLNGYSGNQPPTWKSMTTCRDIGDNLRAGRHFLAEHGLPALNIKADRLVLVGFGPCALDKLSAQNPYLQLGHTYQFAQGADGDQFLAEGFSFPENWGRWTDAKDAFLFFTLPTAPSASLSVAIEAVSLSPAPDRKQKVDVVANGIACGQFVVTESQPHAEVRCPANALGAGDNMLRFHIANPARPIDLGLNADSRQLGLGLKRLTLTPKQ